MSVTTHARCGDMSGQPLWDAFLEAIESAIVRFDDAATLDRQDGWAEVRLAFPGGDGVAARWWLDGDGTVSWDTRSTSPDGGGLDWWLQESLGAAALRGVEAATGEVAVAWSDPEEPFHPEFDLRWPRFRDWEDSTLMGARRAGGIIGLLASALLSPGGRRRDPLSGLRDVVDALPPLPVEPHQAMALRM